MNDETFIALSIFEKWINDELSSAQEYFERASGIVSTEAYARGSLHSFERIKQKWNTAATNIPGWKIVSSEEDIL